MRSLEVLSVATDHDDLLDSLLLDCLGRFLSVQAEIVVVVKLKVHSRPDEGIRGSSFPDVAQKYLPAVQLFAEIQ